MNAIGIVCLIFLSSLLTLFLIKMAIKKNIYDIPNNRSLHKIPTPRGGGLAVAITWYLGVIYLFIISSIDECLFYALLCGLPLSIIGFSDDILNLRPLIRFIAQIICSGLALYFLGGLKSFSIFTTDLELYVFNILVFFAILWSINLFNFLDGIDGYIGSEIVFIGVASFALSGDQLGLLLSASTLGFLIWNWPKAKIFMGDVGSTFLGFTVAILAIYHQNNHIISIWVWLILTSVFWFDATVTLFRRIINKEKLSEAHRKHVYQRAVQSGFSHKQTTVGAMFCNLIGFGLAWTAHQYSEYSIIILSFDLVLLFCVMKYIDKKMPFEYKNRII